MEIQKKYHLSSTIFEEPLPATNINFKTPSLLQNHTFTAKQLYRSSVEDKVTRI